MQAVPGPLDRRDGESVGSFVRRVAEHWLFEGADDIEIASHCGCSVDVVRRHVSVRRAKQGSAVAADAYSRPLPGPNDSRWRKVYLCEHYRFSADHAQYCGCGKSADERISEYLKKDCGGWPKPELTAMAVMERLDEIARLDDRPDLLPAIDAVSAWLMSGCELDRSAADAILAVLFEIQRGPERFGWSQSDLYESLGVVLLLTGVAQ